MEFGLDTFGDVTAGANGAATPHAQVIREVVEEAVLADRLGLDFFGIGEHHRADFAISAPDLVLAAIAPRTRAIRLGTAVTVLSSDEPVRVFQRLSTLDALSGGRAEFILGRGSFTESFPLFGLPLDQYETLFEEKLQLLHALLTEERVSWQGSVRPPLVDQVVYPRPERALRAWVGVGGSPQSVVRAASYGFPVLLAIIGGDPARFQPYTDLLARAAAHYGIATPAVGVHSPGFVGETDAQAIDAFWPHYKAMHDAIGAERGWPPMQRHAFEAEIEGGSLYVGSPETVARKIARTAGLLAPQRFQLKYSAGSLPHATMMAGIERYAGAVVPRVRELLARSTELAAE